VKGLIAQDACVVHNDVDGSERVDCSLDDGLAAVGCCDRVGIGDSFAAEVEDFLHDRLCRANPTAVAADRAAEIVDNNAGTAPSEFKCMLAAKATAGASDDRYLAVETDVSH
jgi:hypothetical protein